MKVLVSLLLGFILLVSTYFIRSDQSTITTVEKNERYVLIGNVGDYLLYHDISLPQGGEAIDYFYEDDKYQYYFSALRSHTYILKNDEREMMLIEALEGGKVSIVDISMYLDVHKLKRNDKIIDSKYKLIGYIDGYKIYQDMSVQYFAQALEFIYEDMNYKYYLTDMRSHIYLFVSREETLDLKAAINSNKVNIEDLAGLLPIYKAKKLGG